MTFISHLHTNFYLSSKISKLPCKLVNLTNVAWRRLFGG